MTLLRLLRYFAFAFLGVWAIIALYFLAKWMLQAIAWCVRALLSAIVALRNEYTRRHAH
jgi:hypothetical protein